MVAEILQALPAIRAIAIHSANPGNAHAGPNGKLLRGAFDNFPDNLMSGNNIGSNRRKVALHDMEIRSANSAGFHSQQHLFRSPERKRQIAYGERTLFNRLWRI
jgi:hypothetical protein